jgi:hypothetical protein
MSFKLNGMRVYINFILYFLDFCFFFQLEKMLLRRCRDHLDQGNHLNEQIDVSVSYFEVLAFS